MEDVSKTSDGRRPRTWLVQVASKGAGHLRVVMTAVLVLVALGAGMGLERYFVADSVFGSQRHDALEDIDEYDTLATTYDLIRENYVQSDEISDEELIWGASEGMMDALGDEGHSTFLNPTEAADYYEQTSGSFVGIGVRIDTEVVPPQIIMPIAGSPAQEAGIRQNDELLAIDGAPYSEFQDMEVFTDLIGGDRGTDVVLELRHFGEAESYEVTITRDRIILDTVFWAMLPNNVLWLRIDGFEDGTGDDVIAALQEGKRLGAEGVLLDLRANPGGLIVEEIKVINQFVEEGAVITIREDASGNETETVVEDEEGEWREGPLVVLIDGNTVSAAEVTTSAIVDNDRGISVGQTTFGTGTSLALIDLDDGSLIFMGVEMWLRPNGEAIWHVGLDPDIAVENEPGVPIALPYLFDDNVVTDAQFSEMEDDQLLTGYDEVMNEIEGGS